MSYVSLSDYAISVSHEELTEVLAQASAGYPLSEDQTRELCESKAESKIINFLGSKYNLSPEFIKQGTARNMQLVGVYIDLALCALYKSVSPDDVPEMRKTSCDDAINTLTMWRDGNLDLEGVDPIVDAVGGTEFIFPVKFISKPESDPLILEETIEQIDAPTDLILALAPADLSWTSHSLNEESGFMVERGIDNINFLAHAILPKGQVTYTDPGTIPATTFYYRVLAMGTPDKSDSDYSNTLTVVIP